MPFENYCEILTRQNPDIITLAQNCQICHNLALQTAKPESVRSVNLVEQRDIPPLYGINDIHESDDIPLYRTLINSAPVAPVSKKVFFNDSSASAAAVSGQLPRLGQVQVPVPAPWRALITWNGWDFEVWNKFHMYKYQYIVLVHRNSLLMLQPVFLFLLSFTFLRC